MNSILKTILFSLNPEHAHHIALNSLNLMYRLGLLRFFARHYVKPCTVMGLEFANPVGLAAGFDKNGEAIDALSMLGFGFIEIGTITPKPQYGNPKPRLFRLTKEEAIINRMGFNNKGAEYVLRRLEKTAYRGVLGINIGKNKDTPLEKATEDYLFCFRQFWKFASYITINISSPNTPQLRNLHQDNLLSHLLHILKQEQHTIKINQNKYVPLVVKISPDLSLQELQAVTTILLKEKIDGVIATNTTIHRDGVETSPYAKETGGLSGKPLGQPSTQVTSQLHAMLQDQIPIIASGGMMNNEIAKEKFKAGAKLLQVYTGFIFSGPEIISDILQV